jgi:ankyrin repeat protein
MKKIKIFAFFLFCSCTIQAQTQDIFDISRKGTLEEIKAVFSKNPESINSVTENKSSPLILACYRNNEAVALFLADKVADINYNSGMGSALMAAVMSGNEKIIEKLISLNADLNLKDNQGKTALIYAVFFNKNEVVKLLLKAGSDKKITDNDGRTALDYATFNKNTELIILLN